MDDEKPKTQKPVSDDERGFIVLSREEAARRDLSGYHFFKTPASVIGAGLSGAARDVLDFLQLLANRQGICRAVSIDTIAVNVGRSRTTVIDATKELERKRIVGVVRDIAASRKSRKTNRYRILYENEVVLASPKFRTSRPTKQSEKPDPKSSEKLDLTGQKNRTELVKKTGPLLESEDSRNSLLQESPPVVPPRNEPLPASANDVTGDVVGGDEKKSRQQQPQPQLPLIRVLGSNASAAKPGEGARLHHAICDRARKLRRDKLLNGALPHWRAFADRLIGQHGLPALLALIPQLPEVAFDSWSRVAGALEQHARQEQAQSRKASK